MADMTPWTVTLRRSDTGATLRLPFYMGPALSREPSAVDVLECLVSDAVGYSPEFEDWAGDYGYDSDSRAAYATWEAVGESVARFLEWAGSDLVARLDRMRADTGEIRADASGAVKVR